LGEKKSDPGKRLAENKKKKGDAPIPFR